MRCWSFLVLVKDQFHDKRVGVGVGVGVGVRVKGRAQERVRAMT